MQVEVSQLLVKPRGNACIHGAAAAAGRVQRTPGAMGVRQAANGAQGRRLGTRPSRASRGSSSAHTVQHAAGSGAAQAVGASPGT